MEDPFGSYHPAICFTFFIAAIAFGMMFVHPAFLAVSIVCASLYYLLLKRKAGIKFMLGIIVLIAVLSFVNPLFNTQGEHVLFTYFGDRPYTLEALAYGAALSVMFGSVLIWFACYNEVMSSDKFTYLFARFIPSLSLIFTMVLRLVPNYRRQTAVITNARMCVGKATSEGDRKTKLNNAVTVLSSLTSWALENAIVTGDSMRSRGYGTSERSNFAIYRMCARDKILLAVLAAATISVICTSCLGAMFVSYSPTIELAPMGAAITIVAFVSYAILLAIPSAIHIWEDATWHILRSRI